MKIEHHNELEKNDLAEGLKSLAGKAKGGQLFNSRFIGLLALLAVVVGVWYYLRGTGRRSDSDMWRALDSVGSVEGYQEFAKGHANTPAARAARVQEARFLLAQNLPQLNQPAFQSDGRKKAIEGVETAREALNKSADEYKDDLTMRAQCLEEAITAELALVGIPKDDKPGTLENSRGSVKKAAELCDEYAKTVGDKTPLGEQSVKRAADLRKNEETVFKLGQELNDKYSFVKPAVTEPLAPGTLTPGKTETPAIPPIIAPGIPAPTTTPPAPPVPTPPPPPSSKK